MSTVDLNVWEPFDQGEFPSQKGKAGNGLCTAAKCDQPAAWMRFWDATYLSNKRRVRGAAYCERHAIADTIFRNAERMTGWRHTFDGAVYYATRDDRIKIGTSTHVAVRVDALHARLLAVEPGSYDLERQRHRQFAHLRIAGEWFHPGPDLLTHIDSLREQAA